MLNDGGLVICEFENDIVKDIEELTIYKEKKYGSKKVIIYKK